MAFVEMDNTTLDGTNEYLADPIANALLEMGLSVADITAPATSDLLTVTNDLELLDRAELRLLKNIHGNLDVVDIAVGPRRESLSQFGSSLLDAIGKLEKKVYDQYGGASLMAGVITQNFASKGDDPQVLTE